MGKGRFILERLAEEADTAGGSVPGQCIVEIAGGCRVLIENHFGVKAYCEEKIMVNVKLGCVSVCGTGLEIQRMTKEQLVIRGKIENVALLRRGQA